MGYLFLAIGTLAGSVKGYCGKRTSKYTERFSDAIQANIFRMSLCVVIGFIVVALGGDFAYLKPTAELLLIAALYALSTCTFVISWLIAVRKSSYMFLDVILMLGVLIPLIGGGIFFDEPVTLTQWIGLVILFIAALIMCSYNNTIKTKITLPGALLLILCGASNGLADFTQKLFVKRLPDIPPAVFNFYTYVFSVIFVVITYLLVKPKKTAEASSPSILPNIYGYLIIMAICLFANSFFKTLAAERLNSILLYPLNLGATVVLAAIMSSVFFHEKLTLRAIIGMITAFVGLIIINVL